MKTAGGFSERAAAARAAAQARAQARAMSGRWSGGARSAAAAAGAAARYGIRTAGKSSWVMVLVISVLVVFMIAPEGFDYSTTVDGAMPTEGSPLSRMIWLGLLAAGAIGVGRNSRQAWALLRSVNPWLLLFAALATASVCWSIDPGVTLRRLVRLATIMLDGMALALVSWRPQSFQDALRPVLTLILVASIIFALTMPELAVEHLQQRELIGAWHGLATQKNGLGSLGASALIFWLHAWLSKERPGWAVLCGLAVSATCLFMSRSSTAILATILAVPVLIMLLRSPPGLRRFMPYLIAGFAAVLLLYSLAVLNLVPGLGFILEPITLLTGKDRSFTGRTAIWAIITNHISYAPLLGSGYGAYWVQSVTSPSYEMLRRLYFYPSESHNGYLDVINDLGWVGGLCLLGYLVTYLRQGLRLFATMRVQAGLYLALLFQHLIMNLSESRWFSVLTSEFVVMTLATFSMARLLMYSRQIKQMQGMQVAAGGGHMAVAPLQARPAGN
jgi:exopolysaccharide production protein ExoQ